jgi:hypothetical protein
VSADWTLIEDFLAGNEVESEMDVWRAVARRRKHEQRLEAVVEVTRLVVSSEPLPEGWVGGGRDFHLLGLEETLRALDSPDQGE